METKLKDIKSRIERARKEENWNDYDWALDSLLIACEELESQLQAERPEVEKLKCANKLYRIANAHLEEKVRVAVEALEHISGKNGILDCCIEAFQADNLDNHDLAVASVALQKLKGGAE